MFTTLINPTQLNDAMTRGDDVFIIDARHDLMDVHAGRAAFDAGHIASARFLHMDEDLSGLKTGLNGRHPLPDLAVLSEKLTDMGLNQTSQVVVYDANNSMMAARAWWLLRQLGHAAVCVLDGGLAAWLAAGCVTDSQPSTWTRGDFVRTESLNQTIAVDELLAHLDDDSLVVIDARAPERYLGEIEPLDPVAGHIPHALNVFFIRNLNSDGTFKNAIELRALWQSTLAGHEKSRIVNQCGSGVTACHNILSQHISGLNAVSLYPGSWSEWCSDASRPVVTP